MELDEPDLMGAIESLKSVLIPPQTLEAWALQRRVFALPHRRLLIGATSGRRIALTRGVTGGFDLTAILWQDLEEVRLGVGLLGARLAVRVGCAADLASDGAAGARSLEFTGLRKRKAQAVYRVGQAQVDLLPCMNGWDSYGAMHRRSQSLRRVCAAARLPRGAWLGFRRTAARVESSIATSRRQAAPALPCAPQTHPPACAALGLATAAMYRSGDRSPILPRPQGPRLWRVQIKAKILSLS